MALLFLDSFDHYTGANPPEMFTKWTSLLGGTITVDPAYAYTGTNGARFGSNGEIGKSIGAGSATMIIGFWMRMEAISGSVRSARLLQFSSSAGTQHVSVGWNLDTQTLTAGLGTSTTNFAVVPLTIIGDMSEWHFYEVKVTIANAGGVCEAWVDGQQHFTFTGDTQNGGIADVGQVFIQRTSAAGGSNLWFDDVYICDATGATNNDFLGPIRIECRFPDANGNYSQFVNSAATSVNNYTYVDEASPDGDTSYVQSGVNGDKDSYGFQALGLAMGETVLGLQTVEYGRKTDIDAKSVRTFSRIGGVDYPNADHVLAGTYAYGTDPLDVSPATGVAWTEAEIDGAEFGIEVRA